MKNDDETPKNEHPLIAEKENLQKKAEEIAREREAQMPVETQAIIHELRVHQIELEMQNEELRIAHEELENVRSRFFSLYELAPVGYCTIANDGNIFEANLTLSKMLGISRGALIGKKISQFVFKDDQDIYYLYIKQLIKINESRDCQFRLENKDGRVFWAQMVSTASLDANDTIVYRITISDITESKLAEEKIKISEEKFKRLFMLESDACFLLDKKTGAILEANDSVCRIYGYSLDELLRLNCTDMSAEPEETMKAVKEMQTMNVTIPVRYHKKKDGTVFPVEITASLFTLDNRQVLLIASRDISERMKTEKELSEHRRRLTDIIDFLPEATVAIDMDKCVIIWNKAMEKMTGILAEEIIGKGDYEYTLPFYGTRRPQLMDLLFTDDIDIESRYKDVKREDGTITSEAFCPALYNNKGAWVYAKVSPLYDADNHLAGAIESILDITDRKQAEAALLEAEIKFGALFKNSPIGIAYHSMIYDETGNPVDYCYIDVNNTYKELMGINPTGRTLKEAFPEIVKDPFDWIGNYDRVAKNGETIRFEQNYPLSNQYYDVVAYQYKPGYFVTAFINITERKKLEIALENKKKLLETTLISVGDGVISTDNAGNIIFMNKAAEELTGWAQKDAGGKAVEAVFSIVNERKGKKGENIFEKAIAEKKTGHFANNITLVSKDGGRRPVEVSVSPILEESGNVAGAVLVFKDITEKKQKQDEIEFLSNHDQLTGVYNRRYFDNEVKTLENERYFPLVLIVTDVNGLKLTNDAFGHKAGDAVLLKVANILKKECRADDIVARIGGDEFVLLLPQTDAKYADIIIDRINKAIEKEESDKIVLTLSMGYAVRSSVLKDFDEVFKEAEDAMYRHKLAESAMMRRRTIDLILNSLFEASGRTMLHSKMVSELCVSVAAELGLDKEDVDKIKLFGLMHDIGNIGIDAGILESTKKLGSHELAEIKRHPEIGFRILSSVNELSEMADCVLEHHERWDGKGYPQGLEGENIRLFARIAAVADAYAAMTSERTYKAKMSNAQAIAEIEKGAGTQFDPEIVKVFVEKVVNTKE